MAQFDSASRTPLEDNFHKAAQNFMKNRFSEDNSNKTEPTPNDLIELSKQYFADFIAMTRSHIASLLPSRILGDEGTDRVSNIHVENAYQYALTALNTMELAAMQYASRVESKTELKEKLTFLKNYFQFLIKNALDYQQQSAQAIFTYTKSEDERVGTDNILPFPVPKAA